MEAESHTGGAEDGSVFMGVNFAGGVAYLGIVEAPERLVLDDPADRIEPNSQLDVDRRLEDFRARLAQELRRLRPQAVGVTRTRRYQGWSYQEAFDRFTLEGAAILAGAQENIPCSVVRQEDAAAAVPAAPSKLVEQMPERLGIERTPYWDKRSFAFATALALAKGALE